MIQQITGCAIIRHGTKTIRNIINDYTIQPHSCTGIDLVKLIIIQRYRLIGRDNTITSINLTNEIESI